VKKLISKNIAKLVKWIDCSLDVSSLDASTVSKRKSSSSPSSDDDEQIIDSSFASNNSKVIARI
jgi:hypothetical protein